MSLLPQGASWRALGGALALLSLLLAAPAQAQTLGTVSGQVSDADIDGPLPGVNVRLQGLTIGATTDADGLFSISAPPGDYTIVFSFTGYTTVREPVTIPGAGSIDLNVELSQDPLQLDDVVVTGYSNRERRNLATSISSIDGAALEDLPTASVDNALQGRSAGVTVLRSSGTPGGGVSVRVRGGTSINGSNEPLYVVDGVPVAEGSFSALGVGNQGTNALSTLDTQNIESIEILKDAASTAIYGTRAANGVVLITTKRGRAGQTQISLETSLGSSTIPSDYEVLSGPEYLRLRNEGVRNQGFSLPAAQGGLPDRFFNGGFFPGPREFPYGNPDAARNLNGTPLASSNFFDELRQTGLLQTYRASVNGGNQTTRFLVSGSFLDEEGALISSGFKRYNGRVNVDHTPNERAIVQASVSYNRGLTDRIENDNNIFGVLTNALIGPPNISSRDSTGALTPSGQFAFDNPIGASQVIQNSVDTKFLGNVVGSYEFVPGFRARVSAGLDRLDLKDDQFSPSFVSQGAPTGAAFSSATFNQRYILEGTLNYRRLFNDIHDLSFLVGASGEQNDFERTFSSSTDFATDLLERVNNGAVTDGGSTGAENSLLSFFGNTDYSYGSKYLLTANIRVDGSSRFGEDNRFAVFPGVALGWNVGEEDFLRNNDIVSQLKIRGSVGRTGQQEIGNFASLGLFGAGGNYAGLPAVAPAQLANPDLKWETTTQSGAGIDFGVLRSRVTGVFDVYLKNTDDLLLFRPLPSTTGFTGINQNIGSVRNSGVELSLTTLNVRTRNFTWETTLNLSRNVNEVTGLNEDDPIDSGFASRIAVGQPLGAFFGYKVGGIIMSRDEICTDATGATCAPGTAYQVRTTSVGDFRFQDIGRPCTEADNCAPGQQAVMEADGRITAEDRTFIGNPNPDLFGGFTNSISAFGFDVSAFLQFSIGNDVFNAVRQFNEQVGRSFGTSAALANRVRFNDDGTVANPDATLPRATFNDPNDNDRDSDFYVEDGSYVRLKTLTVGYNVPTRYISQLGGRSLRIYALGENLITSTSYSGLDPEVSTFDRSNTAFGTDFFTYPQARRFVVGLQVGL